MSVVGLTRTGESVTADASWLTQYQIGQRTVIAHSVMQKNLSWELEYISMKVEILH